MEKTLIQLRAEQQLYVWSTVAGECAIHEVFCPETATFPVRGGIIFVPLFITSRTSPDYMTLAGIKVAFTVSSSPKIRICRTSAVGWPCFQRNSLKWHLNHFVPSQQSSKRHSSSGLSQLRAPPNSTFLAFFWHLLWQVWQQSASLGLLLLLHFSLSLQLPYDCWLH